MDVVKEDMQRKGLNRGRCFAVATPDKEQPKRKEDCVMLISVHNYTYINLIALARKEMYYYVMVRYTKCNVDNKMFVVYVVHKSQILWSGAEMM